MYLQKTVTLPCERALSLFLRVLLLGEQNTSGLKITHFLMVHLIIWVENVTIFFKQL